MSTRRRLSYHEQGSSEGGAGESEVAGLSYPHFPDSFDPVPGEEPEREWIPFIAPGYNMTTAVQTLRPQGLIEYRKRQHYWAHRQYFITSEREWEAVAVPQTLVLCFDWRVTNPNTDLANIGIGVCFGPGSRYNHGERYEPDRGTTMTSTHALLVALKTLRYFLNQNDQVACVTIMTDEQHLVDLLTGRDTGGYQHEEYDLAEAEMRQYLMHYWRETETDYLVKLQLWLVGAVDVRLATDIAIDFANRRGLS